MAKRGSKNEEGIMQDRKSDEMPMTEAAAAPPGKQSESCQKHDASAVSDEVRARNKPSGTHYVEPSPLGIEPVEQTGVDRQTNPPRSNEPARQTAEVPLGTGGHAEPPGGGGRESHHKEQGSH
jgi:hypothetical protein